MSAPTTVRFSKARIRVISRTISPSSYDQFGYALDTLPGFGQRAHHGEQYDHYGRRRFDAPKGTFSVSVVDENMN